MRIIININVQGTISVFRGCLDQQEEMHKNKQMMKPIETHKNIEKNKENETKRNK